VNKIVVEHYPASKLPEDLREGMGETATVKVIVEEEPAVALSEDERWPGFAAFPKIVRKPMSAEEAVAAIRQYRALNRPSVTQEEAVARIRELRDEWDY
jgi:hypothetical protein